MISFLPRLYDDELLYSWLCRYHAASGHRTLTASLTDVLESTAPPSMLLFSRPSHGIASVLGDAFPSVVLSHTTVKNDIRFRPLKDQSRALTYISAYNAADLRILLRRSTRSESRHLRYCPLCASEQRSKYGEAFWQVFPHLFWETDVCPVHGCRYHPSTVNLGSTTIALTTAEESIPYGVPPESEPDVKRIEFSQYVHKILSSELGTGETPMGAFLKSRIGPEYRSARGERIMMERLYKAIIAFYDGMDWHGYGTQRALAGVLDGTVTVPFLIYRIGFFLRISADDMAHPMLPTTTPWKVYDAKIREMHNGGATYREIAERLGGAVGSVKRLGSGRAVVQKSTYQRRGPRKDNGTDWRQMDMELLPQINRTVERLYQAEGRPVRVCVSSVATEFGLTYHQMLMLPRCREAICVETAEHYTCRLLGYAWEVCPRPLTKTDLFRVANHLKIALYLRAVPLLVEVVGEGVATQIREVCG